MVSTNEDIDWERDSRDEIIRKLVESGYDQDVAEMIVDGDPQGRPID